MAALTDGLPPYRTLQAVGSKTFTPPPLDGSLLLPGLLDFNGHNSPSHTIFRYAKDEGGYDTITWGRFVQAIHQVAKLATSLAEKAGLSASSAHKPTFGILAATDYITYLTTVQGVIRAGFVPFPISNRNSPAAAAHLLAKTESHFLFTTPDAPTQGVVNAALTEAGAYKPELVTIPTFQELYSAPFDPSFDRVELPARKEGDFETAAVILHSSGSTAFPKPIALSNHYYLDLLRAPYYNGADLEKEVYAVHGLPPFHATGMGTTFWAIATGLKLGTFKPAAPPTIPTFQNVFEGIEAIEATRVLTVPTFVETWSKDESQVAVLKKLRGVLFAGGPLNKTVGDYLTSQGIHLYSAYGATETGFINMIIPTEPKGEDWEYFQIVDNIKLGFLNNGNDEFELHMIPAPGSTPAVINTTWEGGPAYTTNDLLIRHPTKAHLWKLFGRADDQIMLSTGEKTNPGPIEAILNRDPHIEASLMFGRGRFQNGVIIDPKPEFVFNPTDEKKLAAFRSDIWSTVEQANGYAPSHSRIFKEMIIVSNPEKPFEYTAKHTLRRQLLINQYEAEIEATYASVEESSMSDIPAPTEWTEAETARFVGAVVRKVVNEAKIDDDDDIFNVHGADSLQVTWIRNAILHSLRSAKISVEKVPQNFVYNYPTIHNLAGFVYRTANPTDSAAGKSDAEYKIAEMTEFVGKYTANLAAHKPTKAPLSDVVFLTGTTGALGTNLLASLVASPEVKRVYAYNRPDRRGASIRDRHVASFKDRGVDPALADSEKVVYLEGDGSKEDLGLPQELFNEIRDTVTHYIHNAWRVDFNVTLPSFESSIKSLRVIIDMALASPHAAPPRIMFTSSVATTANHTEPSAYPEQYIENPALPVGAGYGESKWVGERILQVVSQRTPLRPIIIRVGQLCGGSNGAWNHQEWMPLLIKSGQIVKCLPAGAGTVSWLPMHIGAKAIVQMRDSQSSVLHLAHPRPVFWNDVMIPVANAFDVPLVPYNDWVAKLDDSLVNAKDEVTAVKENPALRLINFFRTNHADVVAPGHEAGGVTMLMTDLAVQNAEALTEGQLPQLGEKDALQWISYWKSIGHLTA